MASAANAVIAGRAGNRLVHAITSATAATAARMAENNVVVTVIAAPGTEAADHAIQSKIKSRGCTACATNRASMPSGARRSARKQSRLCERDYRSRDQIGQRSNETYAPEHPGDERRRDGAGDERRDELSRDLSLPSIDSVREMALPQSASGNERAHAQHAQLVADIDHCARLHERHERTDRPRGPRRCRALSETGDHCDAEHRGRSQSRRRRTDDGDINAGRDECTQERDSARHPRDLEQKLHRGSNHCYVKPRYRQHVNQPGGRVSVAHLCGYLALVGDEECARERSVLSECAVDGAARSCSHP